ncbi:MAG: histidine kinase [Bacteroidetes bacterium]|nr:histidine kinase [Bacteroidota bacterium]
MLKEKILRKYFQYRFEITHITIFFLVLIGFQIGVTFIQKSAVNELLDQTQSWYQKDAAERLAIVTTTSLELISENMFTDKLLSDHNERKIISSLNVVFRQQIIQGNVKDICLILVRHHQLYVIESGQHLAQFIRNDLPAYSHSSGKHSDAVQLFHQNKERMKNEEVLFSSRDLSGNFHVLVPFVPNGEYLGVLFMKITPNFSFITEEVSSGLDNVTFLYSALIFIGLLGIFIVSSQAVKERNEAQQKFYLEHEENLTRQIRLEKESLFTKRIYHTNHKAEKIIGFIKEDLRQISPENLDETRKRVITYANFISRIIYDMKWYDQPINTIVNPMFSTSVNEVVRFILDYVFLRISSRNEMFSFETDLDPAVPKIPVNEFVVWEILEPIIQNSIDHGKKSQIHILIRTRYQRDQNQTIITIQDNGVGIKPWLLDPGENGVPRLFQENESTKVVTASGAGYGCYIAWQLAVGKCGWTVKAENLQPEGCRFTMIIKH